MKKRFHSRKIGPAWLRWLFFLAGSMCMGAAIMAAVGWVSYGSLEMLWTWYLKFPIHPFLNALIYGLAVYVLGALLGRLWLSGAIVGLAACLLSLVDYFKSTINGMPLTLADFGLATQLGEVAGVAGDLRPPKNFWISLIALGICTLLLLLAGKLTVLEGKTRFLSFSLSLVLSVSFFSGINAEAVGRLFQVDINTPMEISTNHWNYGLALSLWRDYVLKPLSSPEGYSEAYMRQILSRIDALLAEEPSTNLLLEDADAQNPNIIVVLSESFFDLDRLPGLTYERDPMENFHALTEEGISGIFHSHYLGYGTGYIDMALQYGITGLDFGPKINICFLEDDIYQRFDSLAEQYTNLGNYRAEMFHSYNSSLYNRTVTYPLLGYSGLFFEDELLAMDFDWEGSKYGGYYLNDRYLARGILSRMNAVNQTGQRAFFYAITMENHQPFKADKFHGVSQIGVESANLSAEELEIARIMVEGITRADQGLKELTDSLRQSPEPTIVVFYGDHRPNLVMPDGESIYTKLGLCPGSDMTAWSTAQINELFSTDYVIWANDAALLRGRAGSRRESSVTAIGPQLLELTGQPVSRYWALLGRIAEVCLTNTDTYFVDGTGAPSRSRAEAALPPQAQELLNLRSDVIYDAVYGEQYILKEMNLPVGS